MTTDYRSSQCTRFRWIVRTCLILLIGFALRTDLHAFTLIVEGCNANNVCTPLAGGFRWLLEEDNTTQSPPGVRVSDSVGLTINNSHAPVAASGTGTNNMTVTVPDPAKKYYISVLPDSGFSNGGSMVYDNNGVVTVKVNQHDLPMAQISVLVFKDHNPINNVYDAGEEVVQGASILVFDQGGQISMDACGNPLGTSYSGSDCANVTAMGNGVILTGPDGIAQIKNIYPGKYGIRVVPPGNSADWVQTSTIEGTPGVDAWVKANEPPLFIEGFGTGFHHVFIGFVKPAELPWAAGGPGGSTVTGRNLFNHFGRPPVNQGFFEGPPVNECWIGLNNPATGQGLMAVPCDANSNFTLSGIPAGTYTLVTWDKPLDALFGFNTVVVPPGGGTVNLGNVLSFRWFGTLEGTVFYDANQNGFRDAGEQGIQEQNVNIRFRDGSIYQAQPTDNSGEYSFAEVFPFFKWLVVEVDFARFKATGMTAAVDYGGAIPPENGWTVPSFGKLNPQPQMAGNPNTGNNLSRTETGPVLTQAMQLYLNQTNVIDWGKAPYQPFENGGISGIVYYDTTRAENDPRYNAAEPWQPGIPRVQVCLYQDNDLNGVIDSVNGIAGVQLCDVDNYPFGWSDGSAPKGPEDVVRSGNGVSFSMGDAVDLATTDSWDDNKPTGCIQDLPPIPGVQPCFDNYATWNQVRPGIFDGGYAFGPNLPSGTYIVESIPPAGYLVVKEEDKNVDFGDPYKPSLLLLPPVCVGTAANAQPLHTVPNQLALFPGVAIDPPLAGSVTPLCNMKQISVAPGKNAAADFFFFTEVPKAARVVGFSNNDLSAEFNAGSPVFGEKASPSWIPVSMQDWQGNEVARVYTDEWGSYNAMLPSTYTMNAPIPTGVSPNMLTAVLNHPFLPNGNLDPYYDPRYSITPWTLDYWPGKTTYLDTPLVPIASFTGFPQNGPDVEAADHTPMIDSVSGTGNGPVVCGALPQTATINSMGPTEVLNPDFDPAVQGSQAKITRDYGFGSTQGTVTLNGTPLTITSWSNDSITVDIPDGATTGQLLITRGDNALTTPVGITFHVLPSCTTVKHATPGAGAIQAAIDAAADGDLIIVDPGTYQENVILYKNVKLQGSGAGSTTIFANPTPAEKLTAWHAKIQSLLGADPFLANEAPGIMVLGGIAGFPTGPRLVDGLQIMGSISGGGIFVYDNSAGIGISNNRITGNQGNYGGGITIGMPQATSNNGNVTIAYNQVIRNGGIQGGGGVVINGGATNYRVTSNVIGGNFSRFNGGGISHQGPSNGGVIFDNDIIFNEVAFGGAAFSDGAGIFVGAAQTGSTGSVTINANLIQGNLAGVGSGAGIRATGVAADTLNIVNNMIVNNAAGYRGGGIALTNVPNANIINNTIANNDSTATAALAFAAGAVDSTPQPAGIVSDTTTPLLRNNIIWNNRSFYTTNGGAGGLVPNPASPVWDLHALGAGQLNPDHSILTSLTPPDGANYTGNGNTSGNPAFITSYLNQLVTAAVIDEGGNFITLRFTPLAPGAGNYHITAASPAINGGNSTAAPATDYDGQIRNVTRVDIGADELPAGDAFPTGSVVINGDAVTTNARTATLTLNAADTDGTVTNMRFSWDNVTWYGWEAYATTRNATIQGGQGTKTIYVQFRDNTGNISPVYSDSIIYDTIAPTGSVVINGSAEATNTRPVTLTINATDTANAVTQMRLSWNGTTWNSWETYAATRNATIPLGADGTRTIYIQFRDAAGNVSTTYSDSITYDTILPTGSVVINGGAASTNTRNVTLTLSANGTGSTVTNMRFSWDNVTWYAWETYATTRSASIPGGAGAKTIYVRFRDAAGNVSAVYSDGITYAP